MTRLRSPLHSRRKNRQSAEFGAFWAARRRGFGLGLQALSFAAALRLQALIEESPLVNVEFVGFDASAFPLDRARGERVGERGGVDLHRRAGKRPFKQQCDLRGGPAETFRRRAQRQVEALREDRATQIEGCGERGARRIERRRRRQMQLAGGDGDIEGAAFNLEIAAFEFAREHRGDGAGAKLVVVLIERGEDPRDR